MLLPGVYAQYLFLRNMISHDTSNINQPSTINPDFRDSPSLRNLHQLWRLSAERHRPVPRRLCRWRRWWNTWLRDRLWPVLEAPPLRSEVDDQSPRWNNTPYADLSTIPYTCHCWNILKPRRALGRNRSKCHNLESKPTKTKAHYPHTSHHLEPSHLVSLSCLS